MLNATIETLWTSRPRTTATVSLVFIAVVDVTPELLRY
jgi:hypothetical protein